MEWADCLAQGHSLPPSCLCFPQARGTRCHRDQPKMCGRLVQWKVAWCDVSEWHEAEVDVEWNLQDVEVDVEWNLQEVRWA